MTSLPSSYCFLFVCHGGRLEIESLLLVASLCEHLRFPNAEIVACVPEPSEMLPAPMPATLNLLQERGVRIANFRNELLEDAPIPERWYLRMANKIYLFRIPTDADKLVFLDSDHLLLGDYQPTPEWSVPILARAQDAATAVCLNKSWHSIFETIDHAIPPSRVRVTGPWDNQFYDLVTPPGFNSSLVALDREIAVQFSQRWENILAMLEVAQAVHHPYHYEQGSLAAAIHQSGIPYHMADHSESCRLMRHYVNPKILQGDEEAFPYARKLASEVGIPSDLFERLPEWKCLID